MYRNTREYPRFEGYIFEGIMENSREYTEILHNTHELSGKEWISKKYSLMNLLDLQEYIQKYKIIP